MLGLGRFFFSFVSAATPIIHPVYLERLEFLPKSITHRTDRQLSSEQSTPD